MLRTTKGSGLQKVAGLTCSLQIIAFVASTEAGYRATSAPRIHDPAGTEVLTGLFNIKDKWRVWRETGERILSVQVKLE